MSTGTPPQKSAFVGSDDVQTILALHDERASTGGGTVLLEGPHGVGKGTLLAQVRTELSSRGRLVLFGRAERTGTQAFAAFVEPVSQALAFLETRGLGESFLEMHALGLSVLLPRLVPSAPDDGARDKLGFFESLRAFFIDLAKHTPISLLLLDMHYADEDTRDLARFLTAHLFALSGEGQQVGASGVMVAALRTDTDEGQSLSQSFGQNERVSRHLIRGLTRDTLLSYLAQHPALDALLLASRGRPDDVDELLGALPADTDELLHTRIEEQSPRARRVLEALAVLGTPAPADVLADIITEPAADVAHALSDLVRARVVVRRLKTGELLFAFRRTHDLETVLGSLAPDVKQHWHHLVAAALQKRDDAEQHEQRLALHFLAGEHPEQGVLAAVAACAKLLMTFSYGAAAELAARALPYAEGEERFLLLGYLVEAHLLVGDTAAALAAAEDWVEAAPDEERTRALRQVGELQERAGERKDALRTLDEALSLADAARPVEDAPDRALTLAAMARVQYAEGELDKTQATARAALDAAGDTPAPEFTWQLKNLLAKVAYVRGDLKEAEERFTETLAIAEANGLAHLVPQARVNIGLARHQRGMHREAIEITQSALDAARAAGNLAVQSHASANLAVIEQRLGRLGRAIRHFLEALALFSRSSNRTEMRRTTWNLANLYTSLGDRDRARLFLEQSRTIAEADDSDRGRAFVMFTEGDLAFDDGRLAEASTAYERARAIFVRLGEDKRTIEMALKSGWASLELGDVASAQRRVDEVPEEMDDALLSARRRALMGAALALRQDGEGDSSRGLALLSSALDQFEHHSAPEDHLRGLLFLAERYAAMGDERSADTCRERAQAVVDQMAAGLSGDLLETFRQHPLALRLQQGANHEALMNEAESVTPSAPTAPNPDARTAAWNERYPNLVGYSPALLRVFERLDRITRSHQPTVLVRGESGTGKELVASAIHHLGERGKGPFIRVNCAALVETLLMSELFGHEKGSFTGAYARKIGRFELARGGTIFLDEIGDISPKTQVTLLRVLQERSFERVGGHQTITTDAAVICATHRDLEKMVADGGFREDLYYRLRPVVVEIPPLRDRPADIPALVRHFLSLAKAELGRAPSDVSTEADLVLQNYAWPGNIRELQNVVRSVALFCERDVVEVEHLAEFPELFTGGASPRLTRAQAAGPAPAATPAPNDAFDRVRAEAAADGGMALGEMKRKLEFEAIATAVKQTGGNITRAAKLLKMKRPRLSQIVNSDPELKRIKDASRLQR